MAFRANERGGSAVVFDPEMIQKRREHFRDCGSLRIRNMLG
jgi:hypothetical protein